MGSRVIERVVTKSGYSFDHCEYFCDACGVVLGGNLIGVLTYKEPDEPFWKAGSVFLAMARGNDSRVELELCQKCSHITAKLLRDQFPNLRANNERYKLLET